MKGIFGRELYWPAVLTNYYPLTENSPESHFIFSIIHLLYNVILLKSSPQNRRILILSSALNILQNQEQTERAVNIHTQFRYLTRYKVIITFVMYLRYN